MISNVAPPLTSTGAAIEDSALAAILERLAAAEAERGADRRRADAERDEDRRRAEAEREEDRHERRSTEQRVSALLAVIEHRLRRFEDLWLQSSSATATRVGDLTLPTAMLPLVDPSDSRVLPTQVSQQPPLQLQSQGLQQAASVPPEGYMPPQDPSSPAIAGDCSPVSASLPKVCP